MDTTQLDIEYTFYAERNKRKWHVLERRDGSTSVYYTLADRLGQYVVYDSLDRVWGDGADELTDMGLTYRQLDTALKA
jgi:hypothetical protein